MCTNDTCNRVSIDTSDRHLDRPVSKRCRRVSTEGQLRCRLWVDQGVDR